PTHTVGDLKTTYELPELPSGVLQYLHTISDSYDVLSEHSGTLLHELRTTNSFALEVINEDRLSDLGATEQGTKDYSDFYKLKKIARCTGPFKGYRNTKRADAVYFLSDGRLATDDNIARDRNTGLLSGTTIGVLRCLFSLETPLPKHPALSSVDCLENWIFLHRRKPSEDVMLHLLAYVEILDTDNSGDAASPSQ